MASTGSKTPKQPLWIVVREEHSHGYFHLHAKVTTDKYESGAGRVPYGLDDWYGFNKEPLLSGLRASCQGDDQSRLRTGGQLPVYGFDVKFREEYAGDIDLRKAARMVATLTRVDKGLGKLQDSRGHVKSFGEYLGRLAEVLGCRGFALERSDEAKRRSGEGWDWMSIGDGINRIDHRIFLWSQDGIDRAAGHSYSVVVGNLGTVHQGPSRKEAESAYDEYVRLSRENYGRAAGENVSLWKNGEPVREYRAPEATEPEQPAAAGEGSDQL